MMNKNIRKKQGFTLAEVVIALGLLMFIMGVCIHTLDIGKYRQKALLETFNGTAHNLENITTRMMVTNDQQLSWNFETGSLANLTCSAATKSRSECFKKALIESSLSMENCKLGNNCFANQDKFMTEIRGYFNNFGVDNNYSTFKLSGGVTGILSYMDSNCRLSMDAGTGTDNTSYNNICGVIAIDANGDKGPNRLYTNDKGLVDRFLIFITKNGLVTPKGLNRLVCAEGYRLINGRCVQRGVCPYNMRDMEAIESANPADYIQKITTEEDDCYMVRCVTGTVNPETHICPEPCANPDEQRLGGLYMNEGGDLAQTENKQCCIPISNAEGLNAIRTQPNRNYCLINDIVVPENWSKISPTFTGTFYGNGHTITHTEGSEPLFTTNNGTIENLVLNGVVTVPSNNLGGIVKTNDTNGMLQNIVNNINYTATSNNNHFACISYSNIGTIQNIINTSKLDANFTPFRYGVTSNNSGTIRMVLNTPIFEGNSTFAHGISSTNAATGRIENIINNPIYSTDSFAWTIAQINRGTIQNIIDIPEAPNGSIEPLVSNYSILQRIISYEDPRAKIRSNHGRIIDYINTNNRTVAYNSDDGQYSNVFFLDSNPSTNCMTGTIIEGGCRALTRDIAAPNTDWNKVAGFYPSLKASIMPPQIDRDCQVNADHPLGCFDVLNKQNSFDFNTVWAWRHSEGTITARGGENYRSGNANIDLALRWQCAPYRANGFTDCCRPTYINNDNRLPVCPRIDRDVFGVANVKEEN